MQTTFGHHHAASSTAAAVVNLKEMLAAS